MPTKVLLSHFNRTARFSLIMGRQNNDPTVVHSSIALLQERFKQLERVKVMREERELLRGFTPVVEAERPNPVARGEEPKWFLHTELVRPSRPLSGPHPSLRLDTCNRYDRPEFQALETSLSTGFRHSGRPAGSLQYRNCVSENADVDTSLHL